MMSFLTFQTPKVRFQGVAIFHVSVSQMAMVSTIELHIIFPFVFLVNCFFHVTYLIMYVFIFLVLDTTITAGYFKDLFALTISMPKYVHYDVISHLQIFGFIHIFKFLNSSFS